jgi:type I restriction enzyme S subunit
MTMNQTNYGLKAKDKVSDYFVFFSLVSLVEQLKQHAYGTIFDTITTQTFRDALCIKPTDTLIAKFEEQTAPLMNAILNNQNLSMTLAALRDALLPKLMSGERRVRDVEGEVVEPRRSPRKEEHPYRRHLRPNDRYRRQ